MVVATKISSNISKDDEVIPRMVSLKDSRAVVEDGNCTIWGQLPDIPFKADKSDWVSPLKLRKKSSVLMWESHLSASGIMK